MRPLARMLVPTDFSSPSDLALEYAADMASRYGASIHLLHVMEDPALTAAYPDVYFVEFPALRQEMIEDAERRLAESLTQRVPANVKTTTHVVTGRPARVIAQEATDRGIDLIVMGTHGRGGLAHLMLGSVAERVLRMAPCPVLTVRDTARVADLLAVDTAGRQDV